MPGATGRRTGKGPWLWRESVYEDDGRLPGVDDPLDVLLPIKTMAGLAERTRVHLDEK